MKHDNLIAVAFITASLGLGALVACGQGGEAADAKNPSSTGVAPGVAGGTNPATASKDKGSGAAATPDTMGAMGGGSEQSLGGATPKGGGGPAPTATHTSGPAPKNTGDPPPDPNKH